MSDEDSVSLRRSTQNGLTIEGYRKSAGDNLIVGGRNFLRARWGAGYAEILGKSAQ
ncbi:hypothetical protein BDQ12DRAFT_691150 [Crucibulum laeve]|uniref:Uncharacterized protein n=1 Tax=Crucibulum laeve TaxID=68775 RepID=A0A5C3LMG6_9AGAR|nr:hypothetical protein BDQ12DRAFT_691150 [Crucibulum laeve]